MTDVRSFNNVEILQDIEEDVISSFINGIKFGEELKNHIVDFAKADDTLVHVSSFVIVDNVVYCVFSASKDTAVEDATKYTSRLQYCDLDNPDKITHIDLCSVGDTFNGETVTAVCDSAIFQKNQRTLCIWHTLKTKEYQMVYYTFDTITKELSDRQLCTFGCGNMKKDFSISGMESVLDSIGVEHKFSNTDICLMQKITSYKTEDDIYYYTGLGLLNFCSVIRTKDFINWEYVSKPPFLHNQFWEPICYVKNDVLYYYCRQDHRSDRCGFLCTYNLKSNIWGYPVKISDCQSRADFFEYENTLYLLHAPKDRDHLCIKRVDERNLSLTNSVQCAKIPDYFYPFVRVYNEKLYISFTKTRKHIYLSQFTLKSINADTIIEKFKKIFDINA